MPNRASVGTCIPCFQIVCLETHMPLLMLMKFTFTKVSKFSEATSLRNCSLHLIVEQKLAPEARACYDIFVITQAYPWFQEVGFLSPTM